jgi:hypothetical protein
MLRYGKRKMLFSALPVDLDRPMTVTGVRTESSFAGRLGQRVVRIVTVQQDGRTITLRSGRQHTRLAGRTMMFEVGDVVRIGSDGLIRTETRR